MPPPQDREAALCALALEKPASERASFLDAVCGNDAVLRQRVAALVAAYDEADTSYATEAGPSRPPFKDGFATGPDEAVGETIGRYKLLEKIGEGGCGVVYVAEQTEPVRRRVALKLIKLGMDTKAVVARFEAERQALAMMDHPNIARVLDAGTTAPESEISNLKSGIPKGRPYFVMELVRGIKITDYCDQHRLSTKDRLDLFIKVCQAIQHAHQKGIIHRDIKPSNILVTLHDGVPVPKVIDFGIAKATEGRLTDNTVYTQLHQFIGTPAYMSPEQAEMSGLDIDTRSDIYSLGVLLYELLTGVTPFDAKELMSQGFDAMRRTIREKEPPRPSTRLTQLNATSPGRSPAPRPSSLASDLDWIVMKCLEKDRTRRYETSNGLAADIRRHLDNEPVTARPPSGAYRLQKAWRRHRVLCSAGIAVAVALVGGIIGTSFGLIRAEREGANALEAARREKSANLQAQAAEALARANAGQLETNLYFSRIALAHREITAQPANVRESENLLTACPESLRDWEWHYLKRRRFQEPIQLEIPGRPVAQSVSFSPDGRFLAAGGGDGKVRIWDAYEARLIQTLSNHTDFVVSVAFSPVNSGWIASAGADNRLRLWDWRSGTGREIRSWPSDTAKDYGQANAVAFSPDGRLLAAPDRGGDVAIYDTTTGSEALRLGGHQIMAMSVAFDPLNRWIITGSAQGVARLWDAMSGESLNVLSAEGAPISGIGFTSDGSRAYVASVDGVVQSHDTEFWKVLTSHRIGAPRTLGSAIHPTGARLVTAGMEQLVTFSEPGAGSEALALRELTGSCYSLTFSRDGHRLAAGSRDGCIVIWDATPLAGDEDRSFRTLNYPGDAIWSMAVAPDGRSVAVGGHFPPTATNTAARVQVWNLPGFVQTGEFPGHAIVVFCLTYHPTGRWIASAGDDPLKLGNAKAKVWNLQTGREAFPIESFEGDGRLFSVCFSPDGRWLLGAGNDKKIKVWDATSGLKAGVVGEHAKEINGLTFSTSGRLLASFGNDDVVKLWDGTALDRRQQPSREFPGVCVGFTDLFCFSPDEKRLAIAAGDDAVVIHDLEGPDRKLELVSPGHRPLGIAFSPDGRQVATGGVDCALRLWDATSGKLQRALTAHVDRITRLHYPDLADSREADA